MRVPEKQQLVIVSVIIVMLTGFTFFQYLPVKSKASLVKQRRDTLRNSNHAMTLRIQQLPALYNRLEDMRKSVENYDLEIPRGRAHGLFLQQIADVMSRLGLIEQRITPGLEYDKGKLICIPIDIQCRGKFDAIFTLFKEFEKFDRFVQIEQVNLSNTSDYNGSLLMRAKVNIYYRRQE
ncbi:MAG: type 4a pilus biogenesis protein PilO [Planctomycetes bacterium]|nr:type 4a pilus biogenesis protein PilO [Planctomycetota bacterium]